MWRTFIRIDLEIVLLFIKVFNILYNILILRVTLIRTSLVTDLLPLKVFNVLVSIVDLIRFFSICVLVNHCIIRVLVKLLSIGTDGETALRVSGMV